MATASRLASSSHHGSSRLGGPGGGSTANSSGSSSSNSIAISDISDSDNGSGNGVNNGDTTSSNKQSSSQGVDEWYNEDTAAAAASAAGGAASRGGSRGLLSQLRRRETHNGVQPNTQTHLAREFYLGVHPNTTEFDVQVPQQCYIRKFSPDGQHLVCFSKTLHNVIVYRVNYPFTKHNEAQQQPETVFNRFFSLKFDRNINIGEEILCRDFCLFTEDSRFMILASSMPAAPMTGPHPNQNPLSLRAFSHLEDVRFIVVDMDSGEICDSKLFPSDYVFLANHSGVHMHKNVLAVLSLQHQIIHLLQIKESGALMDLQRIGPYCFEDDELHLQDTACNYLSDSAQTDTRPLIVPQWPPLASPLRALTSPYFSPVLGNETVNPFLQGPAVPSPPVTGAPQQLPRPLLPLNWHNQPAQPLLQQPLVAATPHVVASPPTSAGGQPPAQQQPQAPPGTFRLGLPASDLLNRRIRRAATAGTLSDGSSLVQLTGSTPTTESDERGGAASASSSSSASLSTSRRRSVPGGSSQHVQNWTVMNVARSSQQPITSPPPLFARQVGAPAGVRAASSRLAVIASSEDPTILSPPAPASVFVTAGSFLATQQQQHPVVVVAASHQGQRRSRAEFANNVNDISARNVRPRLDQQQTPADVVPVHMVKARKL